MFVCSNLCVLGRRCDRATVSALAGRACQLASLLQSSNLCVLGRPFAWGQEVWAGHWIKFGWEGAHPNGHACWGTGWGDPHSCEYSMLSRLDLATHKLHPVHVFRQPLVPASKPR